ncbi:MAG TPA: hypothetical protein VGD67_24885 [Pseudonocardiaceae bacterium]
MSGDGAFFSVEYDQVGRVAGRLSEVTDALADAKAGAADLQAVSGSNAGFTTVDAALRCAQAWLDEVDRLTGRVETARTRVTDSVTTYRDTDDTAQGWFRTFETGLEG